MNIDTLISKAKNARLNAHAPYSNFLVGAALQTKSKKIYTGCNIENDGIMSICAERVAFAKAISEGENNFSCIAIVGAPQGNNSLDTCFPCGYCRQFMNEFVDTEFKIYVLSNNETNNILEYKISDLLPHSFKL